MRTELRRSLYSLFAPFGRILDIVALKTPKTRGQAFVVFQNADDASKAMQAMQEFPFYDRPLVKIRSISSL